MSLETGAWFLPRAFRRSIYSSSNNTGPAEGLEMENYTYGLQYLLFPALATVETGPVRLGFGPYVGLLLAQSASDQQHDEVSLFGAAEDERDDDYSSLDYGLMARVGAAYEVSSNTKIVASALWKMGLANMIKSGSLEKYFGVTQAKARDFLITAGLSFGI
ncbi:MAG: outer membrane beta-barrel protein [Bdellovibrionales bacterium]|nr:outer membrane beta-barrel protein [Bdellovibrionales bacterium]